MLRRHNTMLRVLIAEDSATVRELLVAILGADPTIEVVGTATNGLEAIEMTKRLRPQVVTMDIQMPQLDGLAATTWIMRETPTPIVILSGHVDVREATVSMKALRAGALTLLPKPRGPGSAEFEALCEELLATIKAMSEVKIVRRWGAADSRLTAPPPCPDARRRPAHTEIIAITASTGGPTALYDLLARLPADFRIPILITQHVARGFDAGLAAWLSTSGPLVVTVARNREVLRPGRVYLAPHDQHLALASPSTIALSDAPPHHCFRPSGNVLFESVAREFGSTSFAVILSGMGDDGVLGLRAVHGAGGWIVAQDEASSVVFGMPRVAIESGIVDQVLSPEAIADVMLTLD